jgi:predicted N-acetyltransferase YhbS
MQISVRQETALDHSKVSATIIAAYRDIWYSNHKEQFMVDRLRRSKAFIPELSLVAEDEKGNIAGHVLLTIIGIQNKGISHPALALAPLSVEPTYQNQGIGKKLVRSSHRIAQNLGYNLIVILGIPDYYRKLGYEFTSKYDLKLPIKIAEENSFLISLGDMDLSKIKGGTVNYPAEFFE